MNSKSKTLLAKFLLPLLNAVVIGSIFGGMNLLIDFQNNNGGEYYVYESGTIDWAHTAVMFLWGSVPVIAVICLVEVPLHHYLPVSELPFRRASDSQVAASEKPKVRAKLRNFLQMLILPALDAAVLGLLAGALGIYFHFLSGRSSNPLEFSRTLSVFLDRSAPVVRFVFIVEAFLYCLMHFLKRSQQIAD